RRLAAALGQGRRRGRPGPRRRKPGDPHPGRAAPDVRGHHPRTAQPEYQLVQEAAPRPRRHGARAFALHRRNGSGRRAGARRRSHARHEPERTPGDAQGAAAQIANGRFVRWVSDTYGVRHRRTGGGAAPVQVSGSRRVPDTVWCDGCLTPTESDTGGLGGGAAPVQVSGSRRVPDTVWCDAHLTPTESDTVGLGGGAAPVQVSGSRRVPDTVWCDGCLTPTESDTGGLGGGAAPVQVSGSRRVPDT